MSKSIRFGMLFGALFFAAVPVSVLAYYGGNNATLDVYVQVQNQNSGNCTCSNNYNNYNGSNYNNCCTNNSYSNNSGYWGNNSPSNFQISVSGNSVSPANFNGNSNGTYVSLAPGYFSVNPQNVNGWSYSTSGNCSGNIDAGQQVSCTITFWSTNGSYQNCNSQYDNCSQYQNCGLYNNSYCNNQYPYQNAQLSCYPSAQTVASGATAAFSATGGTGYYSWSSGTYAYSGSGSTLNAQFYNPGVQTVEVQSDGQSAYCSVTVVGSSVYPGSYIYPSTPAYYVTPQLPNTGYAPNGWVSYALALILLAAAGIFATPYVRNALAYIRN